MTPLPHADDRCPCGRGAPFGSCCGPVLSGEAPARAPEGLMRSRYTAYVVHDEGHLLRTWAPERRPHAVSFDPDRRWIGLEIVSTTDGGLLASTGSVEFVARSSTERDDEALHERSRFRRDDGRWLYVDGEILS